MSSISRRAPFCAVAIAALVLFAPAALAAPPAAPQVTVGAGIKKLQFDWDIVPQSNYYEFWYKSDSGAPWVKFTELKPWQHQFINNVGVHLFNWDQAYYQVKACSHSGGCATSSTIGVRDRMIEAIGYFKPDVAVAEANFGAVSAISEDGSTMATFVPHANGAGGPAQVYIFAKTGGEWRQQGKIQPTVDVADHTNFGFNHYGTEGALDLSADGNALLVSMPMSRCVNCNGSQIVWVYQRSNGAWNRSVRFLDPDRYDSAGSVRAVISDEGNRIAVRLHAFRPFVILSRPADSWTWRQESEIPREPVDMNCNDAQMSSDLSTLARICRRANDGAVRLLIARAPGWLATEEVPIKLPPEYGPNKLAINHTGTAIALNTTAASDQAPPRGLVFTVRKINGHWLQQGPLAAGAWTGSDSYSFGDYMQWSRDGSYLAVSDISDRGKGTGVVSPPLASGGLPRGAIYLYELRDAGARLRRLIKPVTAAAAPDRTYVSLDFANNGKTLLIGDPEENSNASGIGGDAQNASLPRSGALWLY